MCINKLYFIIILINHNLLSLVSPWQVEKTAHEIQESEQYSILDLVEAYQFSCGGEIANYIHGNKDLAPTKLANYIFCDCDNDGIISYTVKPNNPISFLNLYDLIDLIVLFFYKLNPGLIVKDLDFAVDFVDKSRELLERLFARALILNPTKVHKKEFSKHLRRFFSLAGEYDQKEISVLPVLIKMLLVACLLKVEKSKDILMIYRRLNLAFYKYFNIVLYLPKRNRCNMQNFIKRFLESGLLFRMSQIHMRQLTGISHDQIRGVFDCFEYSIRALISYILLDPTGFFDLQRFNKEFVDTPVWRFFNNKKLNIVTASSYKYAYKWFLLLSYIDGIEYVDNKFNSRPTVDNFFKFITYLFGKSFSLHELANLKNLFCTDIVQTHWDLDCTQDEALLSVQVHYIKYNYIKRYSIFMNLRPLRWHARFTIEA